MEFYLDTSGTFYPDKKDRQRLSKLGFTFEPSDYKDFVKSEQRLTIEINTLQELVEFTRKNGRIVLDGTTIEIYDDYRE